ncbi:hypothetical protein NQ318_005306 [Aromia moschata]|uniref:MENTAL domain-containing protein n=1 Tax=Aromia moschata TaxID=1265417 RepID=A0AAV8XX21_9CUCU|nr:hypothetical protein NQ318_005306 [Aromia moschata]
MAVISMITMKVSDEGRPVYIPLPLSVMVVLVIVGQGLRGAMRSGCGFNGLYPVSAGLGLMFTGGGLPGNRLDPQSHSINTVASVRDYIISEDLLAGQRPNGRMSSIRRFFCLFVTFDLLFTSLMWIICVMLNGEFIVKALTEQVIHYNIHTSLFDVVLVAFSRFVVLLLFYALLYINHWIIISISTASTSGFSNS